MAFTAFQGMKPWSQLVIAAFVVLVSFLSLSLVSVVIAIPFFGLAKMMSLSAGIDLNDPSSIGLLKYLQIVQSIGLFVLPPVIIGWLFSGNTVKYLQLGEKVNGRMILIAIVAVLLINPFITYIGEINNGVELPASLADLEAWMRQMEERAAGLIDRFMEVDTVGGLLFNLFMIAVIPAIGEEFLFRGVIQKILTRMSGNSHWGIWISAFLFSLLHMQFYGFVPRMLLGGLFGYMLVYSGSLWLPIASHFVNNALGVLLLYFENKGYQEVDQVSSFAKDLPSMWPFALLSLGLTLYLMFLLKRKSGLESQVDL